MNSIILNDEEILGIKSLLSEVVDIPLIECVYVKPVISKSNSESKVEIRVLITDNIEYNTLMQKLGVERDVKTEVKDFNTFSKKYNELFENITDGNCKFKVEWSKYYVPWFTIFEEELADEELVNGTIIFDRFGNLTFIQEEVGQILTKDSRLPLIENIDEITNSENKKSSK